MALRATTFIFSAKVDSALLMEFLGFKIDLCASSQQSASRCMTGFDNQCGLHDGLLRILLCFEFGPMIDVGVLKQHLSLAQHYYLR